MNSIPSKNRAIIKNWRVTYCKIALFSCFLTCSLYADKAISGTFSLDGTIWDKVGKELNVDPILIYSVSLIESRKAAGKGLYSPTPYAVRSPAGSKYFTNKASAKTHFKSVSQIYRPWEIDVCAMQINLHWHGHRTTKWENLFELETCLQVGTAILKEAMASAPNDIELGIGRYHNWADPYRARTYGRQVISVMKALKSY